MNMLMLQTDHDIDRFVEILNLLQRWLNTFIFELNDSATPFEGDKSGKFMATMSKYDYLNRLKRIYSVLLFWRKAIKKRDPAMKGWPYVLSLVLHESQVKCK